MQIFHQNLAQLVQMMLLMNSEIKLNLYSDGGQCKIGLESTIIDLTGKPTILRQGIITAEKFIKF